MPWLLKTEPETYSIDDLVRDGRTWWEGVRNYQARNFMRDSMRVGEQVLVYHSSVEPPGIAGIARISSAAKADNSAQDPRSPYFDEAASPANPIWLMVEVELVERFTRLVELNTLRGMPGLEGMALLRRGQRLSVQPVSERELAIVVRLARESAMLPVSITEPKPSPAAKRAGPAPAKKKARPTTRATAASTPKRPGAGRKRR